MKAYPLASRLVLVFIACVGIFLCWRALLPTNRYKPGWSFHVVRTDGVEYYVPRDITVYEDAVTLVTARNFARDGFWRTHFLPNRGGHPQVSLYDFTHTQCEPLATNERSLTYWNVLGQRVQAVSMDGDCVYTHYPPLADWVFGALASIGLDQVIHFKLFAILANCVLLWALYRWLREEVHPAAALVAIVFTGTLPAFLEWGDVLYYHSLQYLLLTAGMLTWRSFLREGRTSSWVCTWLLFFGEALVSYQLTLFFAVMLGGVLLLERSLPRLGVVLKLLSMQACAPLLAFGVHFALISSLFGVDRAWRNVRATAVARITEGRPHGFEELVQSVELSLFPIALLGVALGTVVVVRALSRASLARPLGLLATLLAGGVSFMVAVPGTTTDHGWMMYRQLLPFVVLLFGLLFDALLRSLPLCFGELVGGRSGRVRQAMGAVCLLVASLLVSCATQRNAAHVRRQVDWNLAKNRQVAPGNLAHRHLEVLYWSAGAPKWRGNMLMPVSGMRVGEPPAWDVDMTILGPAAAHYEVWWLGDVDIRRVDLLTDRAQVDDVARHCSLSYLSDHEFRALPDGTQSTVAEFEPAPGERAPEVSYSWLRYALQSPIRSRAVRLTCADLAQVKLRQLEAFSE